MAAASNAPSNRWVSARKPVTFVRSDMELSAGGGRTVTSGRLPVRFQFAATPQQSIREQPEILRGLCRLHVVTQRGAEDATFFELIGPANNMRLAGLRAFRFEQFLR